MVRSHGADGPSVFNKWRFSALHLYEDVSGVHLPIEVSGGLTRCFRKGWDRGGGAVCKIVHTLLRRGLMGFAMWDPLAGFVACTAGCNLIQFAAASGWATSSMPSCMDLVV